MSNVVPLRNSPEPAESAAPKRLWREAVGDQLRAERTERGERIADVAQRAGIAPQYLSEIERGRKDPSSEILEAVTGALELSTADLVIHAARRLNTPVGPLGSIGQHGQVCDSVRVDQIRSVDQIGPVSSGAPGRHRGPVCRAA